MSIFSSIKETGTAIARSCAFVPAPVSESAKSLCVKVSTQKPTACNSSAVQSAIRFFVLPAFVRSMIFH